MACYMSTTKDDLERMLYDDTAEPKALPLSLLAEITNGFSADHQIGQGGFAVVYRGILKNGKVAVKRLCNNLMGDKEFLREVECLMTVKHKNVVRFLGYCADTQGSMELYNGKLVMADVTQRLLCFEYLSKGSLDKYITDASCGLEWRNRYKIIKGICLGLHYLHQKHILHLDLKPANILLDGNWVPKISDFGLSRFFLENQSRAITTNIGGILGYLPPEFCNGEITYLFDRFSLGVIFMELLTGKKGYHDVDSVVESWSNRLEASQGDIQLEQVRLCAEIGIQCTDSNPAKRPDSTQHIIDRLNETGSDYIKAGMISSQKNFSSSQPTNLFLDHTPPEPDTVYGSRPKKADANFNAHIIAERRRREKLANRFIELSTVIPGLKKMDKASILFDAIRHVKQLEEKVKALEAAASGNSNDAYSSGSSAALP